MSCFRLCAALNQIMPSPLLSTRAYYGPDTPSSDLDLNSPMESTPLSLHALLELEQSPITVTAETGPVTKVASETITPIVSESVATTGHGEVEQATTEFVSAPASSTNNINSVNAGESLQGLLNQQQVKMLAFNCLGPLGSYFMRNIENWACRGG